MTPSARLAAIKAAIVERMHEVEPCGLHETPDAGCATCKHDVFLARLIDAITRKDKA